MDAVKGSPHKPHLGVGKLHRNKRGRAMERNEGRERKGERERVCVGGRGGGARGRRRERETSTG